MKTLELEDNVATQLKQVAKRANLSTSELLTKMLTEYMQLEKEPVLMNDIIKDLPEISAFKGDPVEIQRKMRNETLGSGL